MTNQSGVADKRYRYCLGDSGCAGMPPDGALYGAIKNHQAGVESSEMLEDATEICGPVKKCKAPD